MLRPKPIVENLSLCPHGGIDYTELKAIGVSPQAIIDFSVSSNPFGPPPEIREALTDVNVEHYPDSESGELKQALAAKLGVSPQNLIVGNGSTELIRLAALAYFGAGDTVLVPQFTFGEYEVACQLVGAQVLKQPMAEEVGLYLRVAEMCRLIGKYQPRGIFLCNPNNPTGQYLSRAEVEQILTAAKDSLVILDEAYLAFTEDIWSSMDLVDCDNLVILRSMTKDYALAGLRLGYAVAAGPIISNLRRVQPPWDVNAVAQKAGLLALDADVYLNECLVKVQEVKRFLTGELTRLGLSPLPSRANFFLVRVGNAGEFRRALLERGILVRDCTSFGLPEYVRLAPGTLPECQSLIAAIESIGVLQKCQPGH